MDQIVKHHAIVLCDLCQLFAANLISFDFKQQTSYPNDRWLIDPLDQFWKHGFRHHENFDALEESAISCRLCRVFTEDLKTLSRDKCKGWFGLYPWAPMGGGNNPNQPRFRIAFSGTWKEMPGSGTFGFLKPPPHTFDICKTSSPPKLAWGPPNQQGFPHSLFHRVVPEDGRSGVVFEAAKAWLKECLETHPGCRTGADGANEHGLLPTRVIDVEAFETDVRIYLAKPEERAPYIALSHCWGGNIPNKTLKASLADRQKSLALAELPRNFQDAIRITRNLGMRYVWIDALCIVQDDPDDWRKEAQKMTDVYAGATVTICALDSKASTAGILKPQRVPSAVIQVKGNDDGVGVCVQAVLKNLTMVLETCPLNSRAWCMQERLLSPALLHFADEQMFWECREGNVAEDGDRQARGGSSQVTLDFLELRQRFGKVDVTSFEMWYKLVEEYSSRALTFGTDKLPALAGAARAFWAAMALKRDACTYVAGLLREDLFRGVLWGAHYVHVPRRPVWGYQGPDTCSLLAKPEKGVRAPSWSWVAVDGYVHFFGFRTGTLEERMEILDLVMDDQHENRFMECPAEGILKVRGKVAQMFYKPREEGDHVGAMTIGAGDSVEDVQRSFSGVVLDVLDRKESRACWAVLAAETNMARYFLVLDRVEELQGRRFRRIGFCTTYTIQGDMSGFEMREIEIL